jgi:quercetin dioxygenase-like cupin family protein
MSVTATQLPDLSDGHDEADHYEAGVRVTPLLNTTTTLAGQTIASLTVGAAEEVRAFIVEIPPGVQTGWHQHSALHYGYILSGSIVVESEDAPPLTLRAGDAVVESVHKPHNGRNEGSEPVRIMVFVAAARQQVITEPVAARQALKV